MLMKSGKMRTERFPTVFETRKASITLCRWNWIKGLKMRSFWIRSGPKSNDKYPYEDTSRWGKTQKRKSCEDRGSLRQLPAEGNLEKDSIPSSPALGKGMALRTPWFPTSGIWNYEKNFLLLSATQFWVIRYGNPRKVIQRVFQEFNRRQKELVKLGRWVDKDAS